MVFENTAQYLLLKYAIWISNKTAIFYGFFIPAYIIHYEYSQLFCPLNITIKNLFVFFFVIKPPIHWINSFGTIKVQSC